MKLLISYYHLKCQIIIFKVHHLFFELYWKSHYPIFFFEFDSAMKFVNILVLYFCTNLYFVVAICKSLNFPLLSLRLPMNTFAATTTWKSGKYGLRQVYSYLLFYKGWPQPQIMENWAEHCSQEFICQSWQLSNGVIEGRDKVMYWDNKLLTARDMLWGGNCRLFFPWSNI